MFVTLLIFALLNLLPNLRDCWLLGSGRPGEAKLLVDIKVGSVDSTATRRPCPKDLEDETRLEEQSYSGLGYHKVNLLSKIEPRTTQF